MAIGLQTSIWENRAKTFLLLVVFFCLAIGSVYLAVVIFYFEQQADTQKLYKIMTFSSIGFFLYVIGMIFFHKSIIFSLTGSTDLNRKTCPELYNIIENLCISRGLPMVKVGIIEDESLNAFATGWGIKNSYIVFSRGLLKKLNKKEIEAVAAHELTHIINEDVKLMLVITLVIGVFKTIGEACMKTRPKKNSDNKGAGAFLLIGLLFYLMSVLFFPLIYFAISRKREYLADAGSVELTKNKEALISALKKISLDSNIEAVSNKNLSNMFIFPAVGNIAFSEPESAVEKARMNSQIQFEIFSTHPSLEKRIQALQSY